jgi:hypothetical protein
MINRHAIGLHRERVIARALWNGTGLVVWQDVFGEVLPYSAREAAQVRAAVTLLRQHAHCFRGGDALPLIPTAHPDLLANAFIAADGRVAITVINAGDEAISGDLVTWSRDGARGWRAVGPGAPGTVHAAPRGTIAPGQVGVFASVPGA